MRTKSCGRLATCLRPDPTPSLDISVNIHALWRPTWIIRRDSNTSCIRKIYAAWNENKIASLLMMEVSAVYPNTFHQRLLYNLRKRIDLKVVDWVASFLTNCQTIVKTNEHTTPKLSIDLGLPLGSPLSSILYLFYDRDLLDDCAKKGVDAQGYIDDITLIATSKSVKGNNQKLARVHNQVCESWRVKHGSEFSLPKYELCWKWSHTVSAYC